jgi:hypothetical protein
MERGVGVATIRGDALVGGIGDPFGAILCTIGRLKRFGEPGKSVS